MENMINSLKKLGLNRYEALAYIGLNKIKTGQADEISEVSKLPRSRIYDVLKELNRKGFVEIEGGKPLKYKIIPPSKIFKEEKNKLIEELENTEKKLEKLYNDELDEIQAPIWLIHSSENIIEKEVGIIRKARKTITCSIGFLLEGEGKAMIKSFNEIPRNVEIKILANQFCYVNNHKIDIIKIFKDTKLDNLEIIQSDLPMMKLLIVDEKELIRTFTRFTGENNEILPQTAIGVHNTYEDICKNFSRHILKEFDKNRQEN
ncbi:TrmB family transcriptional regulator [Methanobrevibacter gottschalkii]|uniref:TrmB family transcriptional regulator n=1 Tax=Methanobrevibacter gottschalkii TaxID=190974 RepID=UPI0038CF7AE1